jgi:hypothetical protein
VLHWCVFLEDYTPIFHYIRGSDNVIADALSRLPLKEQGDAQHPGSDATSSPNSDNEFFSIARDAPEMFDCFVNLHWTWHVCNSISKTILSCRRNASCYVNPPNSWRIVIPSALLRPITEWYHKVLGHVGSSRLYESISIHFYHPGLQNLIDELVSRCDTSQRCL